MNRVLFDVGLPREAIRIANCVSCQPPKNHLEGARYQWEAMFACRSRYLQPDIEDWLASGNGEEQKVLVALGGIPLKGALNLQQKGIRVQDFHGSPVRDPSDRFWVVPTYHPSHIQRGAFNLLGVMKYDLQIAKEVAQHGWQREDAALVVDPSVEWFERWVNLHLAKLAQDPEGVWLAVDVETPDKAKKLDEGELKLSDRSYQIIRVNVSNTPEEGVTVPFEGPYITLLKRLLEAPGVKCFWNAPYDVPRLKYNGIEVAQRIWDFMWAWHVLWSDLPRGLGFVAPFYSKFGPWKHLAHSDPGIYAAIDAVQTLRIAFGVTKHLQDAGMWDIFERHVWTLDTYVLHPAEDVGLLVDQTELEALRVKLEEKSEELAGEIRARVPEELKPLVPKGGLIRRPEGEEGIVEREETTTGKKCFTCEAEEIRGKHRCKDENGKPRKDAEPDVRMVELTVRRYYRQEEFNPASPPQVMSYIRHRGHTPGIDKKTKEPSTNRDSLEKLWRETGDTFYGGLLKRRAVEKVKGTYVDGSFIKLRTDPRSIVDHRLHPSFLHKPSTLRLSCQSPNLQNVVADRGAYTDLAGGFRYCLVSAPGCVLIEADFSGIEAVLSGYFMGDPAYIRLAKLGIHGFVASHLLFAKGKIEFPAEEDWPDEYLIEYLDWIKTEFPYEYNQCKRCVHGKNYGLTVYGMVRQFPKEFPTIKEAERVEAIYYSVAPKLPRWQEQTRERAYKDSRLGGPGAHPFGYMHWFYNIFDYQPVKGVARGKAPVVRLGSRNYYIRLGEDAKRAVAFYPQSTAAGVIKEAMLRLFAFPEAENYIGDAWNGKTPLRAQIHDSLLLEVPEEGLERVLRALTVEMTRAVWELPMPAEWGLGEHLSIGVEVKVGKNWAGYNDKERDKEGRPLRLNLDGMKKVKLPNVSDTFAGDREVPLDDYDEDLFDDEVEQVREVATA